MNKPVRRFTGRNVRVYLFEDKLVVEIALEFIQAPLPVSWIYWVDYSEIGGLRISQGKVLLLFRDRRVLRLDVEKPESLAKAIYVKTRKDPWKSLRSNEAGR